MLFCYLPFLNTLCIVSYCNLYRDLPLSTSSVSVEMISASKRFKDTSIGKYIMQNICIFTCARTHVDVYVYTIPCVGDVIFICIYSIMYIMHIYM